MATSPVPVIEIGGTHVSAAVVRGDHVTGLSRADLDAHGTATSILDHIAAVANGLPEHCGHWGVAIPGPFDYKRGIGRFSQVGKFESLNGVAVGSELRSRLSARSLLFLNDVTAFGLGEDTFGAGADFSTVLYLTLGTGVGSCFIRDGEPVVTEPNVPRDGHVHYLRHEGRFLEEYFSRRAIMNRWQEQTGERKDVKEICDLASGGDMAAQTIMKNAYGALGQLLSPWVGSFGAQAVIIGGSIARSWNLVESYFAPAFSDVAPCLPAAHPETAGFLGAAQWVTRVID